MCFLCLQMFAEHLRHAHVLHGWPVAELCVESQAAYMRNLLDMTSQKHIPVSRCPLLYFRFQRGIQQLWVRTVRWHVFSAPMLLAAVQWRKKEERWEGWVWAVFWLSAIVVSPCAEALLGCIYTQARVCHLSSCTGMWWPMDEQRCESQKGSSEPSGNRHVVQHTWGESHQVTWNIFLQHLLCSRGLSSSTYSGTQKHDSVGMWCSRERGVFVRQAGYRVQTLHIITASNVHFVFWKGSCEFEHSAADKRCSQNTRWGLMDFFIIQILFLIWKCCSWKCIKVLLTSCIWWPSKELKGMYLSIAACMHLELPELDAAEELCLLAGDKWKCLFWVLIREWSLYCTVSQCEIVNYLR